MSKKMKLSKEDKETPYNKLPYEVREHLGRILAPCDAFRLCLTDARCFVLPSQLNTVNDNRNLTPCLGKKVLHHTLIQSLEQTLQSNNTDFDCVNIVGSFTRLAASLPPDSVAISGSIVLQAVFSDTWLSDIDIYCTSEVSRQVRTWIISNANQALLNCVEGYSITTRNPEDNTFDSNIGFVESYCNIPREGKILQDGIMGDLWVFSRNAATHLNGIPHASISSTEVDHEISTTGGVPIIYDPKLARDGRLKKNIDLVIAREGKNIEDIISGFDIGICQCLFNGKSFHIPCPFDTYNRRSTLNMNIFNNHVIVCYMTALLVECRRNFSTILHKQALRLGSLTTKPNVHWPTHTEEIPGVGALAFLHELDAFVWSRKFRRDVQRVRSTLIKNALYSMLLSDYDSFGHFDRVRPIATHNSIVRIFNKQIGKYLARGIVFTNLPPVIPHVMRILSPI